MNHETQAQFKARVYKELRAEYPDADTRSIRATVENRARRWWDDLVSGVCSGDQLTPRFCATLTEWQYRSLCHFAADPVCTDPCWIHPELRTAASA